MDIVGPSNLEALLKTIPPYWEPVVKQFHERMGHPNTPEGLAMFKAASPLYSADQIVAAMKAKNIPVTYVLFPDEGHGFAKPANTIAFNAVTENFPGTAWVVVRSRSAAPSRDRPRRSSTGPTM